MKRTIFCIVFLLIIISWSLSQEALTSWVEGVSGTGVGSYVGINLSGSVKVDSIGFMPGYFDEKWWRHNNRIKVVIYYYVDSESEYEFVIKFQGQYVTEIQWGPSGP